MPELPDVTVYVEALERHVRGARLGGVRVGSPFVLRSVEPPLSDAGGCHVREVRRLGKRIVLALEPDLFLIVHLMVAGRLRWRKRGAAPPGPRGLAAFDFETGTVLQREQTPEDIGHAAVFLASDEARNITGQALMVDGGVVM